MGESYKLWIEREDRTDDITIILGYIEGPGARPDVSVGAADVGIDVPKRAPAADTSSKKSKTRRGSLGVSGK